MLALLVAPSAAHAQPVRHSVLLTITRLNFDCYPDTVFGDLEFPSMHSLPTVIRWGQAPPYHDSSRESGNHDQRQTDTGADRRVENDCADGINPALKVRETRILYPAWRGFTGTVAFQEVNNDSIPDMVIYMRGKVEVEDEERDTLRPLVVYGQYGLDTSRTLDLSSVPAFQSGPFFAAELTFGNDFENEARRDISERSSWELRRSNVNVRERDTSRDDGQEGSSGREKSAMPVLSVYPNPSESIAAIEAERLPAGIWTVEVVGVNGAVYDRQEVSMTEPGNVLRTVDVHRLPSGYYVLRIKGKQGVAGTYPIVVKR